MIRCTLQVYTKKRGARGKAWHTAKTLGEYKRVEDARKAMYALKAQFRVPVRILSEFGTVVEATYLDD